MTETIRRNRHRGRILGFALGVMIVAFLLVGCAGAVRPQGVEFYQGQEVAAGEVLVKYHGAAPEAISLVKNRENVDEAEYVGSTRAVRLFSRSRNVARLMDELSARSDVESVQPNYIYHATDNIPNDDLYDQLWGLEKIGLPSAWEISTGSTDDVVAVVDTGIDYYHPDLVANLWTPEGPFSVTIGTSQISCEADTHGFNAITNSCDPMDDNNHGTHVSGTIGAAGNNGEGVAGVNWNTKIMGLKFLDEKGSGTTAGAVNAIEFAIQVKTYGIANVRVLSNSWGGTGNDPLLLEAIRRANAEDMLFVAAAGNNGWPNDWIPFYPASYDVPNVVSVAATDRDDSLAYFSNYGKKSVDLGAPGVGILSTTRGDTYTYFDGTSMATPHVSGAAALILSRCNLDTLELKEQILKTVDPVSSLSTRTVTGGRLNVDRAIRDCSPQGTQPTTTAFIASPGSSTYGDQVTFIATVTPSGGSGVPTGTVTFYDGASPFGSDTVTGGQATLTTSTLSGGQHSITASYGGDSTFGSSTSPVLLYTVSRAVTTTSLASSTTKSEFGKPVTFTATVTPATAAGTVTFLDSGNQIGTATLSSGSASLSISTLVVGGHSIAATYHGNSNYEDSTSPEPVLLTVSRATSTITLTSSPNPSTSGQPVTFTAMVSPAAATGIVTFLEGTSSFGEATLHGGAASLSTSALSVGSHGITATYGGDSNVGGSTTGTPIVQTVNPAPSGDFSLTTSTSSLTVYRGLYGSLTITVARTGDFTGPVALSVSGLPKRTIGMFSPNPATGTSSTLMISTSFNTPTGTYPLTITGTSGSISHTAPTVTLEVKKLFGVFGKAAGEEIETGADDDTTPDES